MKYKDETTGQVIEVGSPELNPDLIKGKTQVPDTTPLSTNNILTSDNLKPAETLNPATVSIPSIPDISKIDINQYTPQTLGTEEKKAQSLSDEIKRINDSLLGKSAYKTQQEETTGLPALVKTQNDYVSQLKSLQNEMSDLQNQRTTIESKMQEQAFGRGITAGGLAPLTAGELRKNQIQQATVASKALTISSTLESLKGNILTAQMMSDRAVEAKYGLLEEEQKVKLANLNLILQSPQFSLEEKNRAEARKVIEARRQADIEQKKQTAKDIQTEVFNAVKNGLKDQSIINQMQNAKTAVEAASIAASAGFGTNPLSQEKIQAEIDKIKNTATTTDALMKSYPDAGILRTDTPEIAAQKASSSLSFYSKNNMVRAISNPITGEITYYYSKGGKNAGGQPQIGAGTSSLNSPTAGKTGISVVPKLIQPAIESVLGKQYIDMGKLRESEFAMAQNASVDSGIPLLSKGDSDKIQEANASYSGASSLINKIIDLTKNVITADNNQFSMSKQALYLKGIEKAPTLSRNNEAKEFIKARSSLLSLITRASGEKGVLTTEDVNRISAALPSYGDNKQIAADKAKNLDDVIKSVFTGAVNAYLGSATNNNQNVNNQTNNQQNSGTTLMTAPDGTKWNVPNDKINIFKQNGYQ